MVDAAVLQKRIARERAARREAENLLEAKSRELYLANQTLARQADQEMTAANQLRKIVDSVAHGIIVTDSNNAIKSANRAAGLMFGYPTVILTKYRLDQLLLSSEAAKFGHLVEETKSGALIDSHLRHYEFTGQRRDGEPFPIELTLNKTGEGADFQLISAVRDMTRRRRIESERERMRREIEQTSKLESIGQLAGGIAHEINTPTQYIGDNLRFLSEASNDIVGLLSKYATLLEHARTLEPSKEQASAVAAAIDEIDLDFLLEEIPSAIRQSLEGVEQVARIVLAMKDFSHPSTKEKVAADLNRTVDNALTVCRNEWKHVAQVETELDASLTAVPCFPGELGQVILNLVVNAAHAIADGRADDAALGTIRVHTANNNGWVEIRVSDNGTGIPDNVAAKMFEPFFTTKEVGKGTGQGMAIVRDIVVNKHGGEIDFETQVGKGTTFVVRLPMTLPPTAKQAVA